MAIFNETGSGGGLVGGLAHFSEINKAKPLHPSIDFKVNLFPPNVNLTVGPNTNARTTGMIALAGLPSEAAAHNQRTIQVPGVSGYLKHGDTFTLEGQLALRVKKSHSSGVEGDAFSTPLIITAINPART